MFNNTPSKPNPRRRGTAAVDPRTAWITEFQTAISALLRHRDQFDYVDDMVGREVFAAWTNIDVKMALYPDAAMYAATKVKADRAKIGYYRNEKSQRGEGARGGRTVVSYQGFDTDGSEGISDVPAPMVFSMSRDGIDPVGEFADRIGHDALLDAALLRLPRRQRTVVYLVDGHGYTVTEAAQHLGITRETASRDRAAAFRTLSLEPPC